MRIAVIGHVEHVTIARVAALPAAGDILHLATPEVVAAGGGGIAFFQLTNSADEIHLFTALGNDDAAEAVGDLIAATGASLHVARRETPHTRDIVLITPDGERTIIVAGAPLHPRRDDALPWELLATCDAVYFTAEDPDVLRAARSARLLVVTARRRPAIEASGVKLDVVVGSLRDPREVGSLSDYAIPPDALVLTDGANSGVIETAAGKRPFAPAVTPHGIVGAYGAGDSFAAALTWHLAHGAPIEDACVRASVYGAAVLRGINPIAQQLRLE